MKMNKSMKAEVLKHWFGLDSILFGRKATESLTEEILSNYLTTKGALLSNLFEIYKKIGLKSNVNFETVAEMVKESMELANTSKKRAKELLESESVTKMVREEIKDIGSVESLSEKEVARYVISKRRNAVAIDSMLLETIITKEQKKLLNDWKGKILVNAHKLLRDNLIEISMQ